MTYGFLPSIGVTELVLILGIVVILFGANKLPGLGKAIGTSIKEFKSSVKDASDEEPTDAKKDDK